MTVLFGHPSGNPNSHHAALAYFEEGCLEAFCVPWMPTTIELRTLALLPGLQGKVDRLRRRHFEPVANARLVENRFGEWGRMLKRLVGGAWADERLSYEANDWLMQVMRRECARPAVTAVHAYEDCSLLQFQEAQRLGKHRIYDLPIGYYPEWQRGHEALLRKYEGWLPHTRPQATTYARPEQKAQEIELADLVLVASTFVRQTVHRHADKAVAIAAYGVDSVFWTPAGMSRKPGAMRFIYAGQCSVRKGIPLLIEAWEKAALTDASLDLVGQWQLGRRALPRGVTHWAPVDPVRLRAAYQAADVFVFPSNFEGFGLVMLEAMACGLPVIATDATAGPDVLGEGGGKVIPADNLEALVEVLRWAAENCDEIENMRGTARAIAESMTWDRYRARVREATVDFR